MATVLHNRAYDFTVVQLTNVLGNGFDELTDKLMSADGAGWGASEIGKVFPCIDEVGTPADECQSTSPLVPY